MTDRKTERALNKLLKNNDYQGFERVESLDPNAKGVDRVEGHNKICIAPADKQIAACETPEVPKTPRENLINSAIGITGSY